MLHFRMTMPLYLMMISGSILLLIVLLLRSLLKKRLPGYVFPILWSLVLIRFLVPFSLSSPLSLKVSSNSVPFVNSLSGIENSVGRLSYETHFLDSVAEDTAASDVMTTGTSNAVASTENAEAVSPVSEDTAVPGVSVEDAGEESVGLPVTEDIATTDSYSYRIAETPLSISYQIEDETAASDTARTPVIASYTYRGTDYLHEISFSQSLWLTIYLLGIAVTAGILLLQKYRYAKKLRNSLLIEHNETINSILREMNMAHNLVFSNDEIASPLVRGLLVPRIYLPTRMDFGNTELLRNILAHETMHIRRRDNWIKAVMLLTLCLNWFNPLVWLMARCLSSDLETACDESVLRACQDEDARKNYAFSLLSMAVTAARSSLLYSAFSKTEVEKRIQRILRYKKTSALMLSAVALLLVNSTVVFATGIQAPFCSYLSSTCYYGSDDSRWAFKVFLTRDIALGDNPGKRANDIVLDILEADNTGDPELISEQIKKALSKEFHVEKSAFDPTWTLCLDEDTETKEYAAWELTRDENGIFCYQGESVHSFTDEMNRSYQSGMDGTLDVVVQRNRLGLISSVTAYDENGTIVRLASKPVEMEP